MFTFFTKTWALFFGFAIIRLAHGLQGTLLGVRAIIEGFSYITIGFIVAGYYVGFLCGSIIIPGLISFPSIFIVYLNFFIAETGSNFLLFQT